MQKRNDLLWNALRLLWLVILGGGLLYFALSSTYGCAHMPESEVCGPPGHQFFGADLLGCDQNDEAMACVYGLVLQWDENCTKTCQLIVARGSCGSDWMLMETNCAMECKTAPSIRGEHRL